MRFFLETSVIVGAGLTLSSQRFSVLRSEALQYKISLITSQIVIDESVNKFRQSLIGQVRSAHKSVRTLSHITTQEFLFTFSDEEVERVVERYRLSLVSLFLDTGGTIYPYPKVPHETIARRAMQKRKPYGEGTKDSYRDTLIWHSVLKALDEEGDLLCFVTQNISDFGERRGESELNLHQHLRDDLVKAGHGEDAISIIESLGDIVDSHVQRELILLAQIESHILTGSRKNLDFEGDVASAVERFLSLWELDIYARPGWLPDGIVSAPLVEDVKVNDYLDVSVERARPGLFQVKSKVLCDCHLSVEADRTSWIGGVLEGPVTHIGDVIRGNLILSLIAEVSFIYDEGWSSVSQAVSTDVIDGFEVLY